jgi:hypothetical protein
MSLLVEPTSIPRDRAPPPANGVTDLTSFGRAGVLWYVLLSIKTSLYSKINMNFTRAVPDNPENLPQQLINYLASLQALSSALNGRNNILYCPLYFTVQFYPYACFRQL